jgi:hypothetical protein
MTRSVFTAVALSLGTVGLMACGERVDADTQPLVGGERFEEIRFAELYRPAKSVSKESKTVDLVETESLSMEGVTPEVVVRAYSKALTDDGWTEVQEPQEKRDKSWYGAWTKMGRNVVVTAELGNAEEGKEAPTEFQLAFQRPTKNDQITGIENKPIVK